MTPVGPRGSGSRAGPAGSRHSGAGSVQHRHSEVVITTFTRLIAVFCLVLACCGAAPSGAVLTDLRADRTGAGTRYVLLFSPGTPPYEVYGNDSTEVTLMFSAAARGPQAPQTLPGEGPLRSVTADDVGTRLNVTFHAIVPCSVDARPVPQGLEVRVIPSKPRTEAAGNVSPVLRHGTAGTVEVVPLKYADVSEVVGILASGQQVPSNDQFVPQGQSLSGPALVSPLQPGGASGVISGPQIAGLTSAQPVGQQIDQNFAIDRRLNAIILYGTPEQNQRNRENIAKLDVPLPSVLLETQIVELSDTATRDVGIDFTSGNGQILTATSQVKNQTIPTSNLSLQAAVYDQVTKGNGRLLARPSIVAQSGGTAQIITGDALPLVTSIALSGVNAVSQQVQYVNVGVNLQISPRVSADGNVTSHIYSVVSSVTGYQQGYPTLSQRQATTLATVRNGESFIIGGLLQQNEIRTMSQIPTLGRLPVIGPLFRVRHDTSQNTNLYIIVTPRIIPPPTQPQVTP